MVIKKFADKKVIIRELESKDIKNAKKFCDYINSLIKEDAKILMNKPATVKDEIKWVSDKIKANKNKTEVTLIAESDDEIVGVSHVAQQRWKRNHVGMFGISISKEYRGIGLGEYIAKEVISLAKKKIKPSLKIIELEVFSNNTPAFNLYKKIGFKKVASIPKRLQYKGKLVGEYVMLLEL